MMEVSLPSKIAFSGSPSHLEFQPFQLQIFYSGGFRGRAGRKELVEEVGLRQKYIQGKLMNRKKQRVLSSSQHTPVAQPPLLMSSTLRAGGVAWSGVHPVQMPVHGPFHPQRKDLCGI